MTNLSKAQAVPLAHALIDSICRAEGLRSLAIKGPTLAFHGLRAPRISSDSDVLASPADYESLCEALRSRGWAEKATREVPGALPSHSCSLGHPSWPVDIDIHWYYPGFFGQPQDTFDVLWGQRVSATLANQPVWITGRAGSAVISALHSQRHPRSPSHTREFLNLISVLGQSLPASERQEILALARVGRAQNVLAHFLAQLGIDEAENDLTASELRLWAYYRATHDDGATSGWLLAIGAAPWHRKPAVIARALLPNPRELRAERELAGVGAAGLLGFYVRRFRRGFSALPAAATAARAMLSEKRRGSQ
jgi:hypothetical protein